LAVEETDISKKFSWKNILFPIILGLGAATWLLIHNLSSSRYVLVEPGRGSYDWQDADGDGKVNTENAAEFTAKEGGDYALRTSMDVLSELTWTTEMTIWGLVALLMVVIRDFSYVYRIRMLTGKFLTWRKSFDVIMLWESASALTPSVVGGSGFAIFILNREGLNLGKSTAIVFVTAMMDEIFYILMVPLMFVLVGGDNLFPVQWAGSALAEGSMKALFWVGYGFIVLLTLLITLSIFSFPYLFKRILMWVFSMKLLRRWLKSVITMGDEIIISSAELRGMKPIFWASGFIPTIFSWTARFFTLNFIVLIFVSGFDHLVVYGRQLVMWVIMLISPTPGSSGVAELALSAFFSNDILPVAYVAIVAVLWRLLTYFPYLFIGAAILPGWLKRTAK
jgi:uncharacterized protein (TIRG00374 family)